MSQSLGEKSMSQPNVSSRTRRLGM